MKEKVKKVVLAYSGGLDTSVILSWLIDTYGCEVVAFVANLGQGEELEGLREKGLKSGASKVYIEDLREEFVRDFIFPMLRANAIYEGGYLILGMHETILGPHTSRFDKKDQLYIKK